MKPERVRLCDIEAKVVRETRDAWLLDVGNDKPVWVPKSKVEDNQDGTFTLPEWLAIEKGIV